MPLLRLPLLLALSGAGEAAPGPEEGPRLRIEAGASDRLWSPASVTLPDAGLEPGIYRATLDDVDFPVELRRGPDGIHLETVVPALAAGRSVELELHPAKAASDDRFEWLPAQPGPGGPRSRDLLQGSRRVLRYVFTPYDPDDVENTKKPFHHVFTPDGERLMTKGAGGLYSHHRGIFFGYNKCELEGQSFDIWHAAKGERSEHSAFVHQWAGAVSGGHRVQIDWCDREGEPFATEQRTLRVWRQGDGALMIDFHTVLRATRGPVKLHGDRQHAGVQFRAAQDVAEAQPQTRYLRPAKWAGLDPAAQINDEAHRGLPWNTLRFALDEQPYSVSYLSHEQNPDDAEFSERLYGRFGEYFPWELREDHPLELRYRWWIRPGQEDGAAEVEARWSDLCHPPRLSLVDAR